MNMSIKYCLIIFSFLTILLSSCNTRKVEEQNADLMLNKIEQLINENAFNAAKIKIDSIHLLYPMLVDKRKIAAAFSDTITRRESARTLSYCDSILPLKVLEADSIQRNFKFEKDTVYQEFGNYIYKTQRIEDNTNRNYLKAYVNENAEFFLVSNYCGTKIEHTSVEVSVNDMFASTDTIEITNAAYHSFTDAGTRWETITFKNEEGNRIAAFIAQYQAMPIKVMLHGNKTINYYLPATDKKAILETYNLWVVKKDVVQLQKEIKKAKFKIQKIKSRAK